MTAVLILTVAALPAVLLTLALHLPLEWTGALFAAAVIGLWACVKADRRPRPASPQWGDVTELRNRYWEPTDGYIKHLYPPGCVTGEQMREWDSTWPSNESRMKKLRGAFYTEVERGYFGQPKAEREAGELKDYQIEGRWKD